MTASAPNTPAQSLRRPGHGFAWCGANRHFLAVALILAVSTGGWYFAIDYLGITPLKKPVPWPEDVEVDHKTFQNVSLPKRCGPFVRAEDGELYFTRDDKPILDEEPDGEIRLKDDVLGPLKIGMGLDRQRVEDRRSNWYVCRMYIDTRKKRGERYRIWRLNVYYYTGVRDQIPHVGEACLVAGGGEITDSSEKTFTVPLCRRSPWDKPIAFRRTRWKALDRESQRWHDYVQYYVFSMNDEPINNRTTVRFKLMWPWVKHSYYAKIEFSPHNPITDIDEADVAAEEFVKEFLPGVIDALPTRETIDGLDAAD